MCSGKTFPWRVVVALVFVALLIPAISLLRVQAAGTITGRVFQDFNGNGTFDTASTLTNNGSGTIGVAVDRGVGGVVVTAYDSAGVQRGTATSSATDGTYSLAAAGTGPYRIEFTSLPAGYFPSARSVDSLAPGGTATNSASTVQFVPDGASTNINLAINSPGDYSQNNPEVVSTLYVPGNQITGTNNGLSVLQTFPYTAGSINGGTQANFDAPTANPFDIAANQVGTTFGLAYARRTRLVYAGAYFKRHVGFGPGGPNAIYRLSRTGTGSVLSTITVPGTATNQHDTTNYNRDNCPGCGNTASNVGWDSVGKSSLGGVAISDDESRLYTINLANRTLYALDPTTGAELASVATPTALPLTAPAGTCAANDARPFAVHFYRGQLYVGLVCSAESTTGTIETFTESNGTAGFQYGEYFRDLNGNNVRDAATEGYWDTDGDGTFDAGDTFTDTDGNGIRNRGDARSLQAYVYAVDPVTLAFAATPLVNIELGYRRGQENDMQGGSAVWLPWMPTFSSTSERPRETAYPQPMLTDIAFDGANLTLALRDRISDQVGNGALSNPNDAVLTNLYLTYLAGDLLRMCMVGTTLTLESGGRCNGQGSALTNSMQGPGGGEFYFGDAYTTSFGLISPNITIIGKGSNHDETASGGVEYLPGAPDVMGTFIDPIPTIANMFADGGVRWLNITSGAFTKAYRQYDGDGSAANNFGKSGGIGGSIEILSDPAPIEIGNRVWTDTDGDGVQDPGEAGISGVTVRLFSCAGAVLATAVTDANGEYYFVGGGTATEIAPFDNIGIVVGPINYNTCYQVRLDNVANLTGRLLTTTDQISQLGFDDGSDSDAVLITNPTGSPAGTFPVVTITTGNPGENTHLVDIGFAPITTFSLGNRVWADTDNDGLIDATEVGIGGVSVSCFVDANADGVPDTPATPAATATTDANGYYRCDNLAAGTYVVRVNPTNFAGANVLAGKTNTTGANATDLDSTGIAGQDGENGIAPGGAANSVITTGILSAPIVLGSPGEPTSEADVAATGQGAVDAAANMTVDFGFYCLCVSGTLFNDTGAGADNNNGTLNAGEELLNAYRVRIFDSTNTEVPVGPDGILGTADDALGGMLTNTSGNYSFCGMLPGDYRIAVTPNTNNTSSTPTSANPNDNINNDDNGAPGTIAPYIGTFVSAPVTLSPGAAGALGNNTITPATGATTNPTLDFGILATYSLGNRVWFDTNNDGQIQVTEVGASGVSVSCFVDADANGTPDTPATPAATVTTDASGYYRCDNLLPGNYVVRVNPASFAAAAVLAGKANTTGANATDLDSTSVAGQNGENGIAPTGAANTVLTAGILTGTIALGSNPGEPLTEADVAASGQGAADVAANMTVDAGFYMMCVSGTVWNDNGTGANTNNGILNAGELGLGGYRVRIYDSAGVEIPIGPDGILGTADDATGGLLTDAAGNYNFCGLVQGDYRIGVTALAGDTSSTPTAINPNDNVNNDDNGAAGSGAFTGQIVSNLVTLTPGSAGALSNNTITNASGMTSNPTIDFGIQLAPLSATMESAEVFTDGTATEIRWLTGDETSNLGFNVYRETKSGRELLTPTPIVGTSLRASVELKASGEKYSWFDKESYPDAVYYIEDIDLEGKSRMHGPFNPVAVSSLNKDAQNAALFTELTKSRNAAVSESVSVSRSRDVKSDSEMQALIAASNGVKIRVYRDGWYRVAAQELSAAGFDTSSNSTQWQLFRQGIEVPFQVSSDGSIQFFGRGLDVPETDTSTYYLVRGRQGQRVASVVDAGSTSVASNFESTISVKPRMVYLSGVRNGDVENWFGPMIIKTSDTIQNFSLPNVSADSVATVRVKLQGLSDVDHSVSINLNGALLGNVTYSGVQNREFSFNVPSSALQSGDNAISLRSFGEGADASALDSIAVTYSRKFIANNDSLRFKAIANGGVRVDGFSSQAIRVFEISGDRVTKELIPSIESVNGSFGFSLAPATYARELFAIADSNIERAIEVVNDVSSSLHGKKNAADMVIVTSSRFATQASQLADLRRSQGMRVLVVDVEDIYDEYGFGAPTAEALKQFFRTATTVWRVRPALALLFGDSSYDPRRYLAGDNRNIVPAKLVETEFMETSSDSSLVDFDNDGVEDISIGRLPVASVSEADGVIAKLVRYASQPNRSVARDILISDRGFESANDGFEAELPSSAVPVRVERSSLSDSEMRTRIFEEMANNPKVVTFTGHGSTLFWGSSSIFSASDAASVQSSDFGFWIVTSCLNAFTHQPNADSLAEAAVKNSGGGAIAVVASSGLSFSEGQLPIAHRLTQSVFGTTNQRIGNLLRAAKQTTTDMDVRRTLQLIGDPSLVIR